MISKRLGAAIFLAFLVAGVALAQTSPAEFGRADGGDVGLLVKQPGMWSGSFGVTMSSGSDLASKGFAGSMGGALVADRVWFFATANRDTNRLPVQMTTTTPTSIDAKLAAQLGDRQTLAALAGTGRETARSLSLHWTGVVSSSSVFTASVSTRQATTQPAFAAFTHW